jgi:hypothetical protein
MPNTVYVAKDTSGTFMFDRRPVFEDGIWIASAGSDVISELTWNEVKMLGLELGENECWDVTVIGTLLEKIPDA